MSGTTGPGAGSGVRGTGAVPEPEPDLRRWFPGAGVREDSAVRLFCLPHAGASASTYREWPARLGPSIEALPVQLPGRETRRSEPLVASAAALVELLVEPLMARARGPFALFGHSMGALLAYELAHALVGRARRPAHLFVSGCAAPNLPATGPAVHQLPDSGLVQHVRRLHGTTSEVLQHDQMLSFLLPVLRADFAVCETYRFPGHPPLPVPITVLGGLDDPTVPAGGLAAWRSLTSCPARVVCLAGDHFFLQERLDDVVALIAATLREPD